MNHGWQVESTDGLKGGWSMLELCVVFAGMDAMVAVVTSTTDAGCSVVSCSCSCSCSCCGVVVVV